MSERIPGAFKALAVVTFLGLASGCASGSHDRSEIDQNSVSASNISRMSPEKLEAALKGDFPPVRFKPPNTCQDPDEVWPLHPEWGYQPSKASRQENSKITRLAQDSC